MFEHIGDLVAEAAAEAADEIATRTAEGPAV
jgi:hypothetical protein